MEIISFDKYREFEFSLNNDLVQLKNIAQQLNALDKVAEIEAVQTRIANHTFTLAVVGEFKRGKSTFINALLGKEILPADIVPTSATLNRVAYSASPGVKVIMKPTTDTPEHIIDIGINELSNYVTKLTPKAESIASQVKEAIVYYPIPFCKNNVSIIDTPGLNDEAKMTEVTRSILPQLDAALMVIMPNSPFANSEGEFLQELLEGEVGHILFVVTAMDRVRRESERERVIELIRSRIITAVNKFAADKYAEGSEEHKLYLQRLGAPRIYPISGYDALIAKEEKDEIALEKSGFAEFERVLERFITEERGAITLRVIVEHNLSLATDLLDLLQKRKKNILQERQDLEARFTTAQAQLVMQREKNIKDLSEIGKAIEKLQIQITLIVDQIFDNMISVANIVIEEAEITPSDLTKASWGAVTSVMSDRGGRLLKRVPNRWKKQAEDATKAISESGRSQVFEKLTEDISKNVQTIKDKSTIEIQNEIAAALTEEERKLQIAQFKSAEALNQARRQFEQELDLNESNNFSKALVTVPNVQTDWGSGLHLNSLNSAASSSVTSAKEILNDSIQNLMKRVRREEHDGQWTNHDRVAAFKNSYKEQIRLDLAQQFDKNELKAGFDKIIHDQFNILEEEASTKLESYLKNAESQIIELRDQQIRNFAVSEHDFAEFEKMQSQLSDMQQRMYMYLTQLLAILAKYGSDI